MENLIISAVLLAIIIPIVIYLIRAKKRGQKCIGCPYANQCCNKSAACSSHNTFGTDKNCHTN